jgi:hypothetical protein
MINLTRLRGGGIGPNSTFIDGAGAIAGSGTRTHTRPFAKSPLTPTKHNFSKFSHKSPEEIVGKFTLTK